MTDKNKKFRPLEKVAKSLLQNQSIETPYWLSLKDFALDHAQSFQVTEQLSLTIIPPREIFDNGRVDLERLKRRGPSWLVVIPDSFGNFYGQELELSSGQAKLNLQLIRGANRPQAVGVMTQEGEGMTFSIQTVGGTSKRVQTSFRGRLEKDGTIKIETTLKTRGLSAS